MKHSFLLALLLLGSTSAYSAAVLDSIISTAGRNDKSKAVYAYDANGRNNLITSYVWSANKWEYNSKAENTFDANDNITEVVYSIWDNNVWANMYRYLYTYDANNAQTSFTYQGWNGTAWENSSRYTYKNRNDGVHYEAVYCNWVNGEWYEADSTFTSFNEAGNPTMMKTYRYHHKESGYEKDEWVEASNVVYTYNDKGQQIQRLSQICYYAPEKTYSNNNKYEYEYDEKGDMSHHSYSYWKKDTWEQQHSKDYFYNDAHLLTQTILQHCSDGSCTNSQKEEYTYDNEGNTLTESISDWTGSAWEQNASYTQYFYHNDSSEALDQISQPSNSKKLIKDGQIFILRGNKTFTLQGQEVK